MARRMHLEAVDEHATVTQLELFSTWSSSSR
jgi:hypothetical protein